MSGHADSEVIVPFEEADGVAEADLVVVPDSVSRVVESVPGVNEKA